MLTHIHIRDFAIIEVLDLELLPGMTALTGETGAGKSILLDAIGLVLGDKADSSSVRHGADKAEITLTVDISQMPGVQHWLAEKMLENDEPECLLRRIISATGKSRASINGSPVNLTHLRELGEQLVDIHGQHEHQSLMKRDMQRQMLDDYAGNGPLLDQLRQSYREWKMMQQRLQQLTEDQQQHHERIDLLRFQLAELDELALQAEEPEQLDEELSRLANAEQLQSTAEQGYHQLYDSEDSVYSQLSHTLQELQAIATIDEALSAPAELLNSAQIQLQEACYLLRDYAQGFELDPSRLQAVESRIADIRHMARKYRLEPYQLAAHWQKLSDELATLDSDEYDIDHLHQQLDQATQVCLEQAGKLRKKRQQAAKKLSSGVSQAMQDLGMQGGTFEIRVDPDEPGHFTQMGMDQIEFTVSANPGQPLKALTKVASGGELSRISLAIQMMAAQKLTLPALIFDEVDSGIGGGIAEVVGTQLRALATNRQVLCVTHLPQVASQAHQHYQVTKVKQKDTTSTGIVHLSNEQRIEEISRMIGGVDITPATRALAKEMLTH